MAQNFTSQKKIASRVLKCGVSRVWIDPTMLKDVEEAITAADIRRLYKRKIIKKLPVKGNSSYRKSVVLEQKRKGRRRGLGTRKGSIGSKLPRKRKWIKTIRSLRSFLLEFKGKIDIRIYREIYKKAGSGFFRSRSHMLTYMKRNKIVDDKNVQTKK